LSALAPALEVREILPHLPYVLFARDGLGETLVHLVHELGAMLDHFVHRAILKELPVLVAIQAIILILAAVSIGPEELLCKRHSATLTKLLFHTFRFSM
jgi:hypothetical protein